MTLPLFVDVPMAAFRPRWAREYQESYPVPPPSTLFGMLLSLVGVERKDKAQFAGVKLAVAVLESSFQDGIPMRARIFRKFRRVAQNPTKSDPSVDHRPDYDDSRLFRRPDYQELVLWLQFWLWLRDADDHDSNAGDEGRGLVARVRDALMPGNERDAIVRHGALCLGESSHLVNEIREAVPSGVGRLLKLDNTGFLTMPIWTDHEADNSRVDTFSLAEPRQLPSIPPPDCWITVAPSDG